MKNYDFAGKVAIVTGSTSGIGQGIAERLIQHNASVMITGRNKEKGNTIIETLGENASFFPTDISTPEANKKLIEKTVNLYKRLDMLVLAAGQLGVGKLHELSVEDWHNTIATNLNAVFYLLKYGIPHLEKSKGSIVIIGSIAAFHAFPNHPAYAASKGALQSLVKQVALDYGPNIRINLVSPAQIETPLLFDSVKAFENSNQILKETALRLPMKRLGTVEDIANATMYLLSDEASWITGSNFTIDGGFMST